MVKSGEDLEDVVEQETAFADVYSNAWSETLDDAQRMAEGREAEGWETLVLPAGDTAPEPPGDGPEGRYGLVYVVPGNRGETFTEMHTYASFPAYDVFRATVHGQVFIVTELLDPDQEVAVYVAGNYELRVADRLVQTAAEEGRMYTHLQKLDGTVLGSFEHEDWRKFFPNPDSFL